MVTPLVSIVMSAYNAEATLADSVISIMDQTYQHWELLICDDGSTDATLSLVQGFAAVDERIRVFRNERNRGLTYSLNRCLELAKGVYVARQDADDMSVRDRLEIECSFLEEHQDIAVVSSGMVLFDEGGEWGEKRNPAFPEFVDFVHGSPFSHAASMTRAGVLAAVGGYRDIRRTRRVEDYDLWFRIYAMGFRGANLSDILYRVRDDRDAQRRREFRYRINESLVKCEGFFNLRMPLWCYASCLRPLLVGLVPRPLYFYLRRRRYGLPG